jgi:uncharacterized protein
MSRKKKILILLSATALLITFLFTGAAWYFSSMLLYPPVKQCKPKHFIYCGGIKELKLKYEEVSFTSSDGIKIRGWYVPSKKPSQKAIVLLHGHGATRYEGLRWVPALHSAGYNLLLINLRGHEKKKRKPITMGFFEKRDALAAITFCRDKKKNTRTGIFGVSMGAVTGIRAMAEDNRVAAGIFEAPFSSLEDIVYAIGRNKYGLPKYPLVPMVTFFFDMRSGARADGINTIESVKSISPRPVFIIHCSKDDSIPLTQGKGVYEAAGEPKQFWQAECHHHARAYQSDPKKAEHMVVEFFKRYL